MTTTKKQTSKRRNELSKTSSSKINTCLFSLPVGSDSMPDLVLPNPNKFRGIWRGRFIGADGERRVVLLVESAIHNDFDCKYLKRGSFEFFGTFALLLVFT